MPLKFFSKKKDQQDLKSYLKLFKKKVTTLIDHYEKRLHTLEEVDGQINYNLESKLEIIEADAKLADQTMRKQLNRSQQLLIIRDIVDFLKEICFITEQLSVDKLEKQRKFNFKEFKEITNQITDRKYLHSEADRRILLRKYKRLTKRISNNYFGFSDDKTDQLVANIKKDSKKLEEEVDKILKGFTNEK